MASLPRRRRLALVLALEFAALCAAGHATAQGRSVKAGPFLYRAATAHGSITVAGTYHIGIAPEELRFLSPEALTRFGSVALESPSRAHPVFFDLPYNRAEMRASGRPSLRQELGREELRQLTEHIRRAFRLHSVNLEYVHYLHPLSAALLVRNSMLSRHGPAMSVETRLELNAEAMGRPIHYLEDFNQLFPIIGRPWPDYTRELRALLARPEAYLDAVAPFRAGDAAAFEAQLRGYATEFPQAHGQVFRLRNHLFVERIQALARQPGHHLIVMGVGHLFGKDNVRQLLGRAGLRLERVDRTP